MATNFSSTLQNTNSTDALFRAWVQFIHDTLINGGWVDPGDTGQMNISTAVHPTAINVDVGFRIYRMADTLQATAPVFMRVGYGASSVANTPRVNITFGSGTDGAGNLTGGGFGANPVPSSGSNAASACNSYGSAAPNRCQFLMFVRGGSNDVMIFSVERTKDASGNDTGDGLLVSWGNAGQLVFTWYIIRANGTQPPSELGVPFVLSNSNAATAFSGNVTVGVPLHIKGTVQQPGMGVVVVNSLDFPAQASLVVPMYGAPHTFQLGDSNTNQVAIGLGNNNFAARPLTRVGIRYE